MKNPIWTILLIIIIVGLLAFFVAPEVFDIFKDNINDTGERANNKQLAFLQQKYFTCGIIIKVIGGQYGKDKKI